MNKTLNLMFEINPQEIMINNIFLLELMDRYLIITPVKNLMNKNKNNLNK